MAPRSALSVILAASLLASTPASAAPPEPSAESPADSVDESSENPDEAAAPTLTPDPDAEPPSASPPPPSSPVVHILNLKPDEDYGPLKLAKYRGTTTQAAPNALVVTTHYDELCTEPCGVAVDVSERPIFFLVRDGKAASYGFRLSKQQGEITLALTRQRSTGLLIGGFVLTSLLILPAGIPMLIFANPKVSIAQGPPSEGQKFKKLKKAKV